MWCGALWVLLAAGPSPVAIEVPLESVGAPWGKVSGTLQFRGNPTHSWYGSGPLSDEPRVLWRFPKGDARMCSMSREGKKEKQWCGSGWTGQPVVWERPDGVTEVIVATYDRRLHFLDADTGRRTRPDFLAKDIFKGSPTLDPDGFPLLYMGARDNRLRVIALDRGRPTEIWALRARDYPGLHNDDWDANSSIVGGVLIAAGENGYLYAVRLNRSYDARGKVTLAPEILLAMPGWRDDLIAEVGDRNNSIESSPTVVGSRVYFANGQGRVVGVDLGRLGEGVASLVFDYWTGDDTDASLVVDEEGLLYASVEIERFLPRTREVGQILKLDPKNAASPRVWGVTVGPGIGDERGGGVWSTPALGRGVLYATTQAGDLLVIDRGNGDVVYRETLGRHLWSSPAVVDDTLVVATCEAELLGYALTDPRKPVLRWRVPVGPTKRCIESTPAIWRGRIYLGSWDGHIYAIGDDAKGPPLAAQEFLGPAR